MTLTEIESYLNEFHNCYMGCDCQRSIQLEWAIQHLRECVNYLKLCQHDVRAKGLLNSIEKGEK
jgi:hypothetical protein